MVKVAILHEGHAKKATDNWLLKNLISELKLDLTVFQFYGVDTKSNFFKPEAWFYSQLQELIQDGQINKLLFVIDADYSKNDQIHGGYDNTLQYLESLLLSTLDEEKVKCIQAFLDCSHFKSKDNHKSILNQIYKTAYSNAPFDLKHSHFDELKQKLRDLVA